MNFQMNPSTLISKGTNRSGFTLIEMAVVIIIVGIVVSIVASVLPSLIKSSKIKKADAILEKGEYSIEGFITANDRCPCPDTDGDGYENFTAGATPDLNVCAQYTGNLPFLTLGYPSGNDAWGNTVKYGVYEDLVKTTSGTGTNSFCTILSNIISYYQINPADTSKLYYTNQAGNNINPAYVIVSGGPSNLDQNGGNDFFDGLNEGTDVQFDNPDRIEFHGTPVSSNYDDLVKATAFVYLNGRDCTGTGGPGGTGSDVGENAYPNGCSNGTDDDGDGYIDCDDQDCYGVDDDGDAVDDPCGSGGTNVTITTSSLAGGAVNSDYSATIQATGGVLPYEWDLTNDAGLTDLFLHTYTGQLSGKLNQCPGTYTIDIQVEDSTLVSDGGPTTDTRSFNIAVTTDLVVSRTSGAGTAISWSNPTQQETFRANGGHLGDIVWTLDTDGATGFSASSTGEDTCRILKNGSTGIGTYNFILTGTDEDCSANTNYIILEVTVTAGGGGSPYTVNLESEWHLDECNWDGTPGEIEDATGSLHGTAENGATPTGAGKVCGAGYFDGGNDYLDMGDVLNNVLGTTSTEFSIGIWINPFSLSSNQTNHLTQNCFLAKASDPNNDNLEIGVNVNGTLHLYIDTSGQDKYADFGVPGAIAENVWSFVAVTYNNGSVTVTINSVTYTNTTTWSGGGALDTAAGSEFTIGSSQHINNYFHGKIDEVTVFSHALDAAEIQGLNAITHACSGTCYTGPIAAYYMDESSWTIGAADEVADSSGNGYHGAPNGSPGSVTVNTAASHIGNSADFNGVDGRIDVTGLPVSTTLGDQTTVTFWMFWRGGYGEMPMGWTTYDLYFSNDNFGFNTGGGDIDGITNATATLANGWHHIGAVFSNSDPDANVLTVDGLDQSISLLQGSQSNRSVNTSMRISGWLNNTTYCFDGLIDEFRVYNRGLSISEINEDKDLTH